MKSTYAYFESTMVHNDETITRMFKTEYYTYEKTRLVLRYVLAIALIAGALLAGMNQILQAICLAIGAWLFVTPDFPSKVRAEGVIQSRKGQTSSVTLTFDGKAIGLGNGLQFLYKEIDKLIEDDQYFYIFRDKQTAVMVKKDAITGGGEEAFRTYIQEKTDKTFESNKSLLTMNLRDLIAMIREEGLKRKKK